MSERDAREQACNADLGVESGGDVVMGGMQYTPPTATGRDAGDGGAAAGDAQDRGDTWPREDAGDASADASADAETPL